MSKKIVSLGTAILRNTIKLYDVPNIPHQPVYHDMHAPYKSRIINVFKILMQEKELKLLTINSDKNVTPETIIPVEKINGPILLISSKHDEV